MASRASAPPPRDVAPRRRRGWATSLTAMSAPRLLSLRASAGERCARAGACQATEASHAVMLPARPAAPRTPRDAVLLPGAGANPVVEPCGDLPRLVKAALPGGADGATALPRAASCCLASPKPRRFLPGSMLSSPSGSRCGLARARLPAAAPERLSCRRQPFGVSRSTAPARHAASAGRAGGPRGSLQPQRLLRGGTWGGIPMPAVAGIWSEVGR